MPEYSKTHDYIKELTELKLNFNYHPLEYQLIWLVEILILLVFLQIRDSGGVLQENKNNNSIRFYQKTVKLYLNRYYTDTLINKLFDFRNEYTHSGAYKAMKTFRDLLEYKDELDKLAEFAEVQLNFDFQLYPIIDANYIKEFME